jgi:hypothetical protein
MIGAAPAHADIAYSPSDADFADCPAAPADAVAGTWTCTAMTTLAVTFQLNKEGAVLDQPLRITVAQGQTTARGTVGVWGGISGDPIPLVWGLAGSGLSIPEPHGWKVRFLPAQNVEPGWTIPSGFGLKAQIVGAGLGDDCLIGSDSAPVMVRPQINWVYPAVIDGTWLTKAGSSAIFSMPTATGCGTLVDQLLVDEFVGLPAVATADHMYAAWAVRTKQY